MDTHSAPDSSGYMKKVDSISSGDNKEPNAVRTIRRYSNRSEKADVSPFSEPPLSHKEQVDSGVIRSLARLLHGFGIKLSHPGAGDWEAATKQLAVKLSERHLSAPALGITDVTAWSLAVVLMRSFEADFQDVRERTRSGDRGRYLNNPVLINSTLEMVRDATGLDRAKSRRLLEHLDSPERENELFAKHLDHELTGLVKSLYGKNCDREASLQKLTTDLQPLRQKLAEFRNKVAEAKNLGDREKDLIRLKKGDPARFEKIVEAEIYGSAHLQSSLESLPGDLDRQKKVALHLLFLEREAGFASEV